MPVLQNIELKGKGKRIYRAILLILVIGVPLQIFTYVWMLSNAFKDNLEIFKIPPSFIPDKFLWENITRTFSKYSLWSNLWNTLVLCIGTILIQVTVSSMAAYALSKLKPRGGKYILLFFLGTMMVSNQSLSFPTYIMMMKFPVLHVNLINSFWSLLLAFSAWAWAIFILKGFFDGLPNDLMESARIDGASNSMIFTRIVMPLSKPVFAVVILNTFMAVYNQFLFPLVLLPDEKKWPIMVRIYGAQQGSAMWNEVMVMLVVATLPVVLVYLLTQKYIVQGISMTGLKG